MFRYKKKANLSLNFNIGVSFAIKMNHLSVRQGTLKSSGKGKSILEYKLWVIKLRLGKTDTFINSLWIYIRIFGHFYGVLICPKKELNNYYFRNTRLKKYWD